MKWLQLIRWPNLMIIALTQIAIILKLDQYFTDFNYKLYLFEFIGIVACTLIIAASGFIINDLFDQQTDFYNTKNKNHISNNNIPEKKAIALYFTLLIIGNFASLFMAIRLHFFYLYLLYPLASYSLWLYSSKLKCTPLIGNIMVSCFIVGVICIIPFAIFFLNNYETNVYEFLYKLYPLIYLSAFAFLINLYREIIKDLEDKDADFKAKCNTTAVCFGEMISKRIAILLLFFLFSFLATYCIINPSNKYQFWTNICLIVILISLWVFTYFNISYKKLSLMSKVYMLIGLILFFIF